MRKLIMCKGLPGSGKSTWAMDQVTQGLRPGYPIEERRICRVNKDDIRRELEATGWIWSRDGEKEVIQIRDQQISNYLKMDKVVISDDTNLAPKHETRLRQLAREHKATFEVMDFTNIPVEECIRRDSMRTGKAHVGEKVIRDMAAQYGLGVVKYDNPTHLPRAIICDLDGTLCLHNGRSPYDYMKCDTDLPNVPVLNLLDVYNMVLGHTIILLSGREDLAREKTSWWLHEHRVNWTILGMRKTGDHRKDYIVKSELFDEFVRDKYHVEFVLDDRDQVVKLWRDLGLTCFQVAYGNF